MWRPDQIADLAAGELQARAEALRLEQAVRGLDALQETEFHPIIADGLAAAGFGVACEFPYPGVVFRRRFSERERCDLVLTPSPEVAIADPVEVVKQAEAAAATLFASTEAAAPAPEGIPPEEAYWLEVKLVGQFCFSNGVPGPNRTYASELLRNAASDIPKLARDPRIRHGAVLLVLFTADRPTADHDLAALMHRCLDKELPVSSPSLARFEIPDMIGNTLCTVAVVPVAVCR
jgi:hypothetical protein